MSTVTVKKQADILISQYLSKFKDLYGQTPNDFNRYQVRWGFIDMVNDLGFADAEKTLEYFMSLKLPGHAVKKMLYGYGDLNKIRIEKEKDAIARKRMMAESKRRVEEMNG